MSGGSCDLFRQQREAHRRLTPNTRRMDSAPSRSICRHFMNGSCRFGSRCIFRHEMPVLQSSQICRYFQKGSCWYGEYCRYVHVLQPEAETAAASRRGSVPTTAASSSSSSSSYMAYAPLDRRGSEPAFVRAGVTASQEDRMLESMVNVSYPQHDSGHSSASITEDQAQGADSAQSSVVTQVGASQGTKEEASSSSEDGAAAAAAAAAAIAGAVIAGATAASCGTQNKISAAEAFHLSRDVTCGICMEKVYEKPDPRDHVFGILPNCNHSFCLQCIRTWRKTKDLGPDVVKTCPQCRVSSPFYVPNKYWVEGEAKENVIAAFKEKFRKRRCIYYARYGCCPFKTDCLHRHDAYARYRPFPDFTDNEEEGDYDSIDLLSFFIAMTFLGADDDNDDDDDDDDDDDSLAFSLFASD